jgi:hypothetical protein
MNLFCVGNQCSKWKFGSAGIIPKSDTRIYRQKNKKAVPLHAMEALGGREAISPTH